MVWQPEPLPYTRSSLPECPLPSKDEIRACTNILFDRLYKVVAINDSIVVKFGRGVQEYEGQVMIFLERHVPTIPAPRLYAIYEDIETLETFLVMQRIPGEILDAVRMETESEWVRITKVVWPLVAPSATIVFTLLFVGAFNWFELPYIMGGLDGSPFGSTDVLGLYFYRTAFGNVSSGQQDFGLGSALAVLIFIFIALVAGVITTRLRAREIQL